MKRIGILGGGQLGKMTAVAAHKLGFKVCVFTESDDSPAVNVVRDYVIAPFTDKSAIFHFAESVDIVTFETENIPSSTLELLRDKFNVPNIEAIKIAQNRLLEKAFLRQNKILTTEYWPLSQLEDLPLLDFPVLVKTTSGGYDGKGQFLLKNKEELAGLEFPLIAEKLVDIEREFSIVIARNKTGKVHFPIAENVHVNGILTTSKVPADITSTIATQIKEIGFKIADLLKIKGLLCVEFFLDKENQLMVNELAPRPHNSCHWSMDCCDIDQFEELILAVTDNNLKQPTLVLPCTMQNILGDEILLWRDLVAKKNVRFYNYGKEETKALRKMGHVNILHA